MAHCGKLKMRSSRKRRCKYGKLKQKTKGRVCKKRFSRHKSRKSRSRRRRRKRRSCKYGKLKRKSGRRRCKKRRKSHRMSKKATFGAQLSY